MTTAMYAVEEMIYQPWKAAVSQGVRPVLGVRKAAAVDHVAGGRPQLMVMRGARLGADAVHDPGGNPGFAITAEGAPVVGGFGEGPSTRHVDTQPDGERSKSSKDAEGRGRHRLPSRGTGRGALASKTSRTGTVPAHFLSTSALVHCESTLQPVIGSAGRRGRSRRKQ